MAIPIIDSFERASNKPVDKSMQVNNLEDRDTFPSYKRWEGMPIYVIDEAKEYTLIGGIENENWIQTAPSSSGDASLWSTFPATQSVEMDDYSLLNVNSLVLPNGSSLHAGTTDAGYGGNGGIELECSVGYKLKWDAGRLFTMQQDGFTIREVAHQAIAPTTTDDNTKGYVIGSRWLTDSGDTYIATDATESAAVWGKQSIVKFVDLSNLYVEGFASFSTKRIWGIDNGRSIDVFWLIEGISVTDNFFIEMPFDYKTPMPAFIGMGTGIAQVQSATSFGLGLTFLSITFGSSQDRITVVPFSSFNTLGTWSTTGIKRCNGRFSIIYKID